MDALTRWSFILCGAMVPVVVWDIWRTRRRAREATSQAASTKNAALLPLPPAWEPHFRLVVEGQAWEADFTTMTLSVLRFDSLPNAEPVLYELSATEDGTLRMRPNDESRQIMVANIESRLADHRAPYRAEDEKRDRAKLAELHARAWSSIPQGFSEALQERYAAFLRQTKA